jgi:tRNA 2-thiocytidine biosynthesis protein TtcA
MEITAEILIKDTDKYTVYDIRGNDDLLYGTIPNAAAIASDELLASPPADKTKPIVIVCARGQKSLDTADELCAMGYTAYSLRGGYAAWLREEVRIQSETDEGAAIRKKVEESIQKKFHSTLMSPFTKALKDYELVKEGDRVAVCMSGGKDSMLMAMLFRELMHYSNIKFDVKYLVMDPGYNEENRKIIEYNAKTLGIPINIFETRIFDSVYKVDKSPCYLCARMRRGYLYSFAQELGCNKIALGHHFDDVIETLLMGLLHSGQIQGMMPKLHSTNYPGMELIRPLYLIREDDIKAWRDYNGLRFLQCACRFTDTCTTCNNGQNHSKRQETKELIRELKKSNPDVEKCLFRALGNVHLDTMIGYKTDGVRHSFLENYDN